MPHGASSGWVQTGPLCTSPSMDDILEHLLPVLISAEAFARRTWPCRACKANSGRLERCTPADLSFQNVDFHATEGTKKTTREDFLWKERILRDKQSANRSGCRGRKTRESDAALALLRSESRFLAVACRRLPMDADRLLLHQQPHSHHRANIPTCDIVGRVE